MNKLNIFSKRINKSLIFMINIRLITYKYNMILKINNCRMIRNIEYLLLITFLLIVGGWIYKALIAFTQGEEINFNLINPLNLKARWPKEKEEKQLGKYNLGT